MEKGAVRRNEGICKIVTLMYRIDMRSFGPTDICRRLQSGNAETYRKFEKLYKIHRKLEKYFRKSSPYSFWRWGRIDCRERLCYNVYTRRDQAPRLSVRRKCTRRQTLSEGTRKSVRISEEDSSDPQSVKIFESIAGRIDCGKIRCSDVDVEFAVILPVLFHFWISKV